MTEFHECLVYFKIELSVPPFISFASPWPIHDSKNVTLVCHSVFDSLPQDEQIRHSYFWSINGTRYDPVKEQLPAGHQVPANSKGNALVVTDVTMTDDGRAYSCMMSEDGSRLESPESNTVMLSVAEEHKRIMQVSTNGEETSDFSSNASSQTHDGNESGSMMLNWQIIITVYFVMQTMHVSSPILHRLLHKVSQCICNYTRLIPRLDVN